MMRRLFALAALALLPALASAQGAREPFPHARHAKLFPTCTGCHAGVPAGDASRTFPSAASCANCHDGMIQPPVTWQPPARRANGLLTYSHPAHAQKAKDVGCTACHASTSAAWMMVAKAAPDQCVACHTPKASAHLADDNKCTTCHRPLTTATALSAERVAGLPKPPSHNAAGFVSAHGAAAKASMTTCATCHARESCARCHVDASRSPVIQTLGADARIARAVAGKAPVYPAPADHKTADFMLQHGATAKYVSANCATCHTRTSCETCHVGDGAKDVLKRMPAGADASAPGVQLRRAPRADPVNPAAPVIGISNAAWVPQPHQAKDSTRLVRVHATGYAKAHGRAAASGEMQCAGCHAQKFCADCHGAEKATRRYHPGNFVATHAPQAYGRETNCSGCHNAQAFCRDCHAQAGLAVKNSSQRSATYHNARPQWLLQHGRAARQDLATCATCHQQTYCMQCHSQLGSRISPHGPGFDAARMSAKNSQTCLVCHFKNPLAK